MSVNGAEILSPDGRYRWDGGAWVLAQSEPAGHFALTSGSVVPAQPVTDSRRHYRSSTFRQPMVLAAMGGMAAVGLICGLGFNAVASDKPVSATTKAVPAPSASPAMKTFGGVLQITEAVSGASVSACIPQTTQDMQIVLSDAAGSVVAVSGDPTNPVMESNSSTSNAFIANCSYTYTVPNVPMTSRILKLTITGDFGTYTKFSGLDPVRGEYLPASSLSSGTIPSITASIEIGMSF
jgi:hypothetical protein